MPSEDIITKVLLKDNLAKMACFVLNMRRKVKKKLKSAKRKLTSIGGGSCWHGNHVKFVFM